MRHFLPLCATFLTFFFIFRKSGAESRKVAHAPLFVTLRHFFNIFFDFQKKWRKVKKSGACATFCHFAPLFLKQNIFRKSGAKSRKVAHAPHFSNLRHFFDNMCFFRKSGAESQKVAHAPLCATFSRDYFTSEKWRKVGKSATVSHFFTRFGFTSTKPPNRLWLSNGLSYNLLFHRDESFQPGRRTLK